MDVDCDVPETGNLIIFCNDETREELRTAKEENEDFDSDSFMYELFESLVANSDLEWLDAEQTGDLTDAPILGILDENDGTTIVQRWAFMSYEVISVQQQLLDTGKAVFIC